MIGHDHSKELRIINLIDIESNKCYWLLSSSFQTFATSLTLLKWSPKYRVETGSWIHWKRGERR